MSAGSNAIVVGGGQIGLTGETVGPGGCTG